MLSKVRKPILVRVSPGNLTEKDVNLQNSRIDDDGVALKQRWRVCST